MTIRKLRKAQIVYECSACNYVSPPCVDLFTVTEAQNRHVRGNFLHLQNVMVDAFRPLVEFVTKFASAAESMQDAFTLAPPPNRPHDPSLLKDRRKWGGR